MEVKGKMKKIVNGLLYDTEKAQVVSRYTGASGGGMTLYRTSKSRYFLHTKWSTIETIDAMTDEEAFEWLAEYDPDKAKELFLEKHIEEA